MPIFDIDVVGGLPGEVSAQALAVRLADALGTPAGSAWVRLSQRPAAEYAENGPAPDPLPVFVRVLARIDDAGALPRQASRIAASVSQTVGRPQDCVHVIFEPDARDRVFFGGAPDSR